MASAEVSAVMIMPGGMTRPPTSWPDRPRLTWLAGTAIPSARASTVRIVTTASWGRVTVAAIAWP
jgi:hypothetical protein